MLSMSWEELNEIQPVVLQMLANSIKRERVAHAYLFEGERGTRKKEIAVLFAKSLLCDRPVDGIACDQCNNCKRINNHNHPDVHAIEPDGLSIKKNKSGPFRVSSAKQEWNPTRRYTFFLMLIR